MQHFTFLRLPMNITELTSNSFYPMIVRETKDLKGSEDRLEHQAHRYVINGDL